MNNEINPDAIKHRTRLQNARKAYGRGEIDIDELHAAADEYIAFLKAYRKNSGKKFRIPSRAYLIRAL